MAWEHGPAAAIVAVLLASNVSYIIRDQRTIKKLEARVLALEEYQRTTLMDLVGRCNHTMERLERILEKLI